MAFSLTKCIAHGTEAEEPVNKRYIQRLILEVTATTADIDFDIGDIAGTFWTAVGATQPGTAALAALKDINARAKACIGLNSPQLMDRIQAAAASGTDYTVTMDTYGPSITCDTSNGESAWQVVVTWYLKDGAEPVSLVATSSAQAAA